MQSISYFDVVHILVHYTVAWPSTWWMVYCGDRKELLKILESLTLTPTAIIINMALVGLFTLAPPLGLGIFFWRKSKGRWRFFLIGCIIFPVFVLILERTAHSLLLYGAPGAVLQGNIWLYAFYAGLMAGVFEECGRWLAFKLSLRWSRGPGDALMYGAGHGGIEAILLAGMTMLSNITLALALNRGGLEAVDRKSVV